MAGISGKSCPCLLEFSFQVNVIEVDGKLFGRKNGICIGYCSLRTISTSLRWEEMPERCAFIKDDCKRFPFVFVLHFRSLLLLPTFLGAEVHLLCLSALPISASCLERDVLFPASTSRPSSRGVS